MLRAKKFHHLTKFYTTIFQTTLNYEIVFNRASHIAMITFCVLIPSSIGEESIFLVITGVQLFQKELKPVRRVSADANLK